MPTTARKKPQRRRREWKVWYRQLAKMRKTLYNVKTNPAPCGERWRHGMVTHYEKVVAELVSSEPQKYED